MRHTQIKSLRGLANYLRCESAFLESFLTGNVFLYDDNTGLIPNYSDPHLSVIHTFNISKKHGGYRKIYSVESDNYKNVLKIFNTFLKGIYVPINSVQGFVPKRSIRTNAAQHLGKKAILSVDLKHFYESITCEMVEMALTSVGFRDIISKILSKLLTLEGKLVQGYTTSPIVANLVSKKMDSDINDFLKQFEQDITYTRYADDLYFSSNQNLPEIKDIEKIIHSNGFELNQSKTKVMKRGRKQYVTGLTVFDDIMPRISKKVKRNLRLEVYFINKLGYHKHILRKLNYSFKEYNDDPLIRQETESEIQNCKSRILGWINFINSVEKEASRKLYNNLHK
jgi:hypothetical protein